MPITVNEGGTLYTLDTVTANEGGTLYELNEVWSNEGGTLYKIHESGVKLSWTYSGAPITASFTVTYKNGVNILDTDYTNLNETITSSNFTLSKTSTLSVTKTIKKNTSSNWQYFYIGFAVYNSSNTKVWSFDDGNTSSTSSGVNSSSVSLNAGTYYIVATIGNAQMDGITLEISIK